MLSFELKGGEPGEKPPDMERDLERLRDLSAQLSAAERQMLGDLLERMGAYLDSTGSAAALFAALTASAVSFLNHMAEDAMKAHPELLEEADGALRTRILRKVRVPLIESGTELTLRPGVYEALPTTGGTDGERAEQATVLYTPAGGEAARSIPLKAVALALAVEDAQEADVRELAYLYMHAAADVAIPGDEEIEAMVSGRYKWPHAVAGGPGNMTRRRTPRTYDTRKRRIEANIDPITKALTGRGENSIGSVAYWLDEPTDVPTGNGGTAGVTVRPPLGTEIDARQETYVLNGTDSYWHDAVSTLFYSGQTEVTGAQILSLVGYANPYREDMAPVMCEAAESIAKMIGTTVAIDTTKERRRKGNAQGGDVIQSIALRQVMGVELSIEKRQADGGETVRDFRLEMIRDTPDEAFPLSAYARSRSMLTAIDQGEYTFETVKPELEARKAWHYILKQVHQETRSNTVKLETMWRDLELKEPDVRTTKNNGTPRTAAEMERARKDAVRKRRGRIITQLEKMLDEATGRGMFAGWKWSTDKKTAKPDGFEITPARGRETPGKR